MLRRGFLRLSKKVGLCSLSLSVWLKLFQRLTYHVSPSSASEIFAELEKKWNSIHVISVIMAWNHPFATPKEGGLPKQRQHQRGPSCLGGCEFDAAGRVYVTWEKSAAIGRFETGNERSYSIVVLVVYRRYSVALAAASFSNPYTALTATNTATGYNGPGLENFGFGASYSAGATGCGGLTCSDPGFNPLCIQPTSSGGALDVTQFYTNGLFQKRLRAKVQKFVVHFLEFMEKKWFSVPVWASIFFLL